jgi:hypothetical protein
MPSALARSEPMISARIGVVVIYLSPGAFFHCATTAPPAMASRYAQKARVRGRKCRLRIAGHLRRPFLLPIDKGLDDRDRLTGFKLCGRDRHLRTGGFAASNSTTRCLITRRSRSIGTVVFRHSDILRQVFEALVRVCMDAGLVKGEGCQRKRRTRSRGPSPNARRARSRNISRRSKPRPNPITAGSY